VQRMAGQSLNRWAELMLGQVAHVD
jgi:hypothetical protein